jgi:hypothetical protein
VIAWKRKTGETMATATIARNTSTCGSMGASNMQDIADTTGGMSRSQSLNNAFRTAKERGVLKMAECVLCGYEIKDCMTTITRLLTRQDIAAFEFNGKNLCGNCHDELSEFLESE